MADEVTVFFNPRCSKCRLTRDLLDERDVTTTYFHYVDEPPTDDQIRTVMTQLGIDDPRAMMRTGETIYRELGLADAEGDELVAAMASHPILIERPIVIVGDRAVIARPPELALDLL
jgi:arsenate reductase